MHTQSLLIIIDKSSPYSDLGETGCARQRYTLSQGGSPALFIDMSMILEYYLQECFSKLEHEQLNSDV